MAAPVMTNPNVADRSNSNWWVAPIGVGTVLPNPVYASDLPIADPHVAGQLWNNAGVITESTG
jgi:hypothetical protein